MSYKIQEPQNLTKKTTIIHVLEDTIVSEATSSSLSNHENVLKHGAMTMKFSGKLNL